MSLSIFTIYDHPTDYPHHFVVREFIITKEGCFPAQSLFLQMGDLDVLHAAMRLQKPGLIFLPRQDDDDPKIIGVYL